MTFSKSKFALKIPRLPAGQPLPGGISLRLDVAQGDKIERARGENIECVVFGEAYIGGKPASAEGLLPQLAGGGAGRVAPGLDGAFFIIFIDYAKHAATVISDPTGSWKFFYSADENTMAISDSPAGLGLRDISVDPVGLAEYVLNGIPLQNRTIYSGVMLFPRASTGVFEFPSPRISTYWNYEFDDAFAGRSEASLMKEFGDLLVEGSRIRAAHRSGPMMISLSGGYDSTCILGSLVRSKPKNEITAFSYATDPTQTRTDATVARDTCRRLGIEHHIVAIPNLSLHEIISRNAGQGFCAANLCGEIGVWDQVPECPGAGPRPTCFFGDNAFGHDQDWRISTVEEMLAWLPIASPASFGAIAGFVKTARRGAMEAGFDSAFQALMAESAKAGDVSKQRDYLYFDQRVALALMPWRHFFCGLRLHPVNPLLDKAVLDFYRHLPYPARRARRLYKKTVRHLFPELLAARRAVFYGSGWDLNNLLREDAGVLAPAAQNLSGPLSEYLDGGAVSSRLAELAGRQVKTESALKKWIKICLKGTPLTEVVRSFTSRSYHLDPATVVVRILLANSALEMLTGGDS